LSLGGVAIEGTRDGGGNTLTAVGEANEPVLVPPLKPGQIAVLPPKAVPKTERAWDVMTVVIFEWW